MPALLTDKDLLGRLVAFPSVSREPSRPIADFVCGYLDGPGVTILRDADESGGHVNLVARLGPEPDADRGGLVLSGHLDVVPAEEPTWRGDPFTLREEDGRYVGRGACDMKGFLAVAINLFAAQRASGLRRPLVLVLTCEEELGSLGAKRLAAAWPAERRLPRSAIVGEPTSLRAVRMHKGHLKLRVTVHGRSAHSGTPHLGVSAIDRAERVLAALRALRETLAGECAATSAVFADVPFPVLSVGRIAGGTAINVIPDRCVIELGVRLLPGGDAAPMLARVRAAVATASEGEAAEVDLLDDSPPMLLDEHARVYRDLCAELGQEETLGVSFSSDGGVLQRDLGLECVLFGPGCMDVAHGPEEHVAAAELPRAGGVLEAMTRRFCLETADAGR